VRGRRRAGAAAAAVRRSLPEAVDLLNLAVGAGLTVPLAVAAVGRRHQGPVGAELARVAREVEGGRRCADALEDAAARLGPDARPVLSALVASERYGAPLADSLARLAGDVRADQRRRAEESARRVPVKLLFPLVLCVLPAFALLTVAPLLAGALGSLRL
jgi:tight adherence protein C